MKITVAIAIVLLLLACAKDNPFKAEPDVQWQGGNAHPHIEATGTESGGPGSTQLTDLDPDLNKVQDAIYLTFDKDMDPATIVASSFVMEKTDPGSGIF